MSDIQSNASVKMSSVDASGSTISPRSEGATWRRGVALAGIAALLIETIAALMQAPRVEPMRTAMPLSLEWWRYPVERNAIQRMPVTGGPLSAVYALRGTDEVWFAGTGGLIVHSRDGGRTWDSTNVSAALQRAVSPATPAPNAPAQAAPLRTKKARARMRNAPTPRASLVTLRQDAQGYGSPQSQQSPTQQSPAQQSYSKDPKQSAANAVQQRPVQSLVTVPNAVGLSIGPAEKLISTSALRSSVTYTMVYDSAQTNVVSSQSLRAGTQVPRGTAVVLSVGRYVAPAPNAPATRDSQPAVASQSADTTSRTFFPRLTAICIAAPGGMGWAVGERGAAFRTTDGGDNWRQVQTGVTGDFETLACNATTGAVAASGGGDIVWLRADAAGAATVSSVRWNVGRLTIGSADTVWSSGNGGGLRWSADRGRTWTLADTARRVVAALDGGTRLAVDSTGTISRSTDGGRSWAIGGRCTRDPAATSAGSAIVPASASMALMVDSSGLVSRITGGGVACAPVFQLDGRAHQVAPASESVWYAASDGAFRSDDGGRTWHALITTARFASLAFRDSLHGVAGLENGLVGTTSDGGRRWTLHPMDYGRTSAPIHFAHRTASEIFAADDRGRVFRSADGASSWERRPATDSVVPLLFTDARTGWGVTPNGATWTTQDGGTTWSTAPLPGSLGGLTRAMSDSAGRFALRRFGVSHAGGNLGQVWVTTPTNHLVAISSVGWDTLATGIRHATPVAGAPAFGLDTLGTLMRSTDGRAWTAVDLAAPRKYPAPWYYALAMLTVAGTLVTARARRPADEPAEESIADILVSDRPLREGDRDVLDFGKIAAGLSRFIRNTRTEPPLTIAVTGPWGTGKSSLMNLLRRDLQRRGFRTIWFNAWHHQREESLLASLLEAIRLTATPPLWSPIGIRFRLRLLAKRFHRYRAALVLLPVFALAVGYILKDPERRWNDLGAGVQAIMGAFKSEPTAASKAPSAATVARSPSDTSVTNAAAATTTSAQSGTTSGTPRKTVVALIISIVGTILTYFKGLKAFGMKPGEVAKSVMSAGRVRTIESQLAFRYRFAQDFSEVTQALKPERLVIFVDDLDRCKPEQVLEILEAINFLAESGDCVVVLGIDRERVTGCVAIGFKDVATVLAEARTKPAPTPPPESLPKPDIGRAVVPKPYILAEAAPPAPAPPPKTNLDYQIEYARHYLEKLLNMEIPIPPATPAGLGNVMTSSGAPTDPEEEESTETTEEIRDRVRRRRRGQIYAGAIAAATIAAFVWGLRGDFARRAPVSAPREIGVLQAGAVATDTTAQPVAASSPVSPTIAETEPLRRDPMPFVAGTAASTAWWVHVPLALVAIATLLWLLTPREDNRVEDSQAFATALRAWAPVLFEEHPTPRSAKKFLNKMRFLSMAQRAPTERRAPVESLIERLSAIPAIGPIFGRTPSEEPPDALLRDAIPEVTLVSLNVIRDRYPEWLNDPSFWTCDLHEYVEDRIKPVPPEIAEALKGLGDIESRLYMGRHKDAWQRLELWVRDA